MRFGKQKLSDERGIAVPVALAVLVMVAGLATVAARSGITATHQSFRDRNAKSAIQAAQSALQVTMYRANLLQPRSNQCVVKDAVTSALSKVAVQADGWCAPQTETLGDGATYTVQVSQAANVTINGQMLAERKVVATGTANGVSRRATVTVDASTGDPLFPFGYAMVGKDKIEFKNTADITGNIGSNGDIEFKNNADVCGNITPGPSGQVIKAKPITHCAGDTETPATQPFTFQPVDMSGPNEENDNIRLFRMKNGGVGPADSCTNCNKVLYNEVSRVLTIQSTGVVTLSGNVYSLCRLDLQNGGQLKISARTEPLVIYIDTPVSCGSGAGMGSVNLAGQVLNVNSDPASFVLMVAGSTTTATTIDIEDNAVTAANAPMAIYAPNSTVDFKNNLDWKGALVAKTIKIKNKANIDYDNRLTNLFLAGGIRFYEAQGYKECATLPTATAPDSGC
jgi:type II secretory pathway pseudopilin PulG